MNEAANDFPGLAGMIVKYRSLSEPNQIAESEGFRPLSSLEKKYCYSPSGRSVLGETVPEVLRGRYSDQGQSFSQYEPTLAGEYYILFFSYWD